MLKDFKTYFVFKGCDLFKFRITSAVMNPFRRWKDSKSNRREASACIVQVNVNHQQVGFETTLPVFEQLKPMP